MSTNLKNRMCGLKWWLAVGVTMVILVALLAVTSSVNVLDAQAVSN